MKVIKRRDADSDDAVRREVEMLQRVGLHRGVSELISFYETGECFYLVMEFVGGGEIFDALIDNGPFSERQAADVIRQVADAAAFLHAQGLCHADIKPENLLLTERGPQGQVKLVDFGLTTELRSPRKSKPGTWAFWPPEAFGDGSVGKPTDMWAIGVVLFILLSGYHPFDPTGDATDEELQKQILDGAADWNDPVWENVSTEAKGLVAALLRTDPAKRLSIEQLLQESWLRSGGARSEPLPQSDGRLRRFRQSTAQLRAAVFATILQQQHHARPHEASAPSAPAAEAGGGAAAAAAATATPFSRLTAYLNPSGRAQPAKPPPQTQLRRHDTRSGRMLEADMLGSAFRVFDPEGKGFITEDDLGRVLASLGKSDASAQELHNTMHEAARADREGKRVLYGDFIDLMSSTERRRYAAGELVCKEGDPADGFYLLLSGSVDVLKQEDGSRAPPTKVDTLVAGEYFGETALLSHAPRRATLKCNEAVEVLRLSREDFEAGFVRPPGAADGSAAKSEAMAGAELKARQALGFIQMVSSMQRSTLSRGETAFREGDVGDRFFILEGGHVEVERGGEVVNTLQEGDCFGELALLTGEPRNATVRCSTGSCQLLSMGVADFSLLMRRSASVHSDLEGLARTRTHHRDQTKLKKAPAAP